MLIKLKLEKKPKKVNLELEKKPEKVDLVKELKYKIDLKLEEK